MVEQNLAIAGLNTDYEISTILGNFSEQYIYNTIKSSLDYRFRPFSFRSPDYPSILKNKFAVIREHSSGYDKEIYDKEIETYHNIISTIVEYYNLVVVEEIPNEQAFAVAYYLYQLLGSEFTVRMINMYTNYIINNADSLANSILKGAQPKTNYSSKLYTNPNFITIYDNMSEVLDIIAGLDIRLDQLFELLSDRTISDLLCTYIQDIGDIYKNHFASFITNQVTAVDILSTVRLNFVNRTAQNVSGVNSIIFNNGDNN